jgi:DNA-binding protein YbaB
MDSDEEYELLSRKVRNKKLKEDLGETDFKQQVKDGLISVAKKGFRGLRSLRVDTENTKKLFGDSSGLRAYNDPTLLRKPK